MVTELTPTESRVLAAYRGMDYRAKGEAMLFLERRARDWPAPAPPPKLRLVGTIELRTKD